MHQRVRNWMIECGYYVGDAPHVPPLEVVKSRYDLIEEEASEVLDAMQSIRRAFLRHGVPEDTEVAHLFKEMADLMIVLIGTFVAFGISTDEVFEVVMKNNDYKLDYMEKAPGAKPRIPPEIKKMLAKEVDFELRKLLR